MSQRRHSQTPRGEGKYKTSQLRPRHMREELPDPSFRRESTSTLTLDQTRDHVPASRGPTECENDSVISPWY